MNSLLLYFRDSERQIATIESHQPMAIPTVTCDFASDISTSDANDMQSAAAVEQPKDTLKVHFARFNFSVFLFVFDRIRFEKYTSVIKRECTVYFHPFFVRAYV